MYCGFVIVNVPVYLVDAAQFCVSDVPWYELFASHPLLTNPWSRQVIVIFVPLFPSVVVSVIVGG